MSNLMLALGNASRALQVNQRGVSITGHNIANADTPGYTRQRQRLEAGRPLESPLGAIGTGVRQGGIDRLNEAFIIDQLIVSDARNGALGAESKVLELVEAVLNEQNGEGLGTELSRLFAAFEDLAASPTEGQPTERAALVATAQTLVDTFHRVDRQLRDIQRSADRELVGLLAEANDLSSRIADLNNEIIAAEVIAPANDLRDERERLVRDLAKLVDVSTFEESNGSLTVITGAGVPLVTGARPAQLVGQAVGNPFDPTFSNVFYSDGTALFDIGANIRGGEIGGLLDSRDVTVADAIRAVDSIAYTLIDGVNAVHSAGFGLQDGVSRNFFTPPAAIENAARDLAIEADILSDERNIAAGTTGPPALEGDIQNAQALARLRETDLALFLPGDPLPGPASGPDRTLNGHVASLLANVGQQTRSVQLAEQQEAIVLEQLEDRRDSVSGVSMDEEVTNLIRLEAAFQANSRIVSTIDELLGQLVSIL
ncbi:MAG: flagellar hook-associated protein FlgK [Proteobacteria bacterium]|nr:flagellar hook-associated protein FlgK [Pseudomonadota bacterium]